MVLNYKKFNPNAFQLLKYVLDITVRFIYLYGGSSSGKTFSVAQVILILTMWEGSNTLVLRKVATSIKDTIYQSFKAAADSLGISGHFKFVDSLKVITCLDNGARIVFKGLDDEEKIKGLESFKRVVMEELNEFEERDHKQIRKRLRGMEGQQIIQMFNPVDASCWIKKKLFDTQRWHEVPMEVVIGGRKIPAELTNVKTLRMNEGKTILNPRTKEPEYRPPNTVIIQSTYLNNFWIVGSPDGTYGFYDEQCVADFEFDRLHDPDYYNVYALAEWGVIRTGSEFFGSFNRGVHSTTVSYDPELPIHISVDNNVLPYISFTFWQIHTGEKTILRQIDEVCAESPNNTVRKAAKLVAVKLKKINPNLRWKIHLHGDASTRAANSIDDEKRSWLDLLIDALKKDGIDVIDCVGNKNPSVPMSGEFINAIYEGAFDDIGIEIGENCEISIEDYMSVQKDVNGAILKTKVKNKTTGQTYEEHGHLCFAPDTPVVTQRGTLPICKVERGDYVMTEKGWEKVHNSMCTIRKSQIFSLSLQGRTLDLTYDHPIFTNRGFIPAYELKSGDIITRYSNGKIWQEKLSSTEVLNFIATLMANVKAIGSITADGLGLRESSSKSTCTGIYGNSPMIRYLKAIAFITLMGIAIITHLIISPLCLLMSMRNFISRNMESLHGSALGKVLKKLRRKLRIGIHLKKAKSGIQIMLNDNGSGEKRENLYASVVEKPLKQFVSNLQNSVLTAAKPNGDSCRAQTMKSVFVRFVGLNLLSINILRRCAVHGHLPLAMGGTNDVYNLTTESHTFFANGVLVHNCDTKRYMIVDALRAEFTAFSNQRKYNLYADDGAIRFYNPDTRHSYSCNFTYCMPDINGRFALISGMKCGQSWHIVGIKFMEATSTEMMKEAISESATGMVVLECSKSYYVMARELRESMNADLRVIHESGDLPRRIAATADFVKNNILFSKIAMDCEVEYGEFIANMLDYNRDSKDNIEASAALSGFIQAVLKLGL